jgi:hypothetical protein
MPKKHHHKPGELGGEAILAKKEIAMWVSTGPKITSKTYLFDHCRFGAFSKWTSIGLPAQLLLADTDD